MSSETRSKFRIAAVAFSILVALVGVTLGWGYLNARADPIVRRAKVSLPDWPANSPPITAVLLSDIHFGSGATDAARLARVVDQIDQLQPDLILIAGDFIAGTNPDAGMRFATQLTEPLSRFHAKLGVFAVLGNHDHWTSAAAVRNALTAAGITVLTNAAVKRGPVVVIGIDDGFTGHDDVSASLTAAASLDGARVVVTHTPDTALKLPSRSAALVLAGHTHCGQANFPLIGSVVINSPKLGRPLYDPRYRCGLVQDPGRTVIVTGGIGASLPIRYNAPPDIWLLTLGR